MKEFNFSRTKLKINIDGESYEIMIPAVDEAVACDKDFSPILTVEDQKKITSLTMNYFKKLGLPNKAYKKLEGWQVKELLLYFQDPKKNA